MIHSLYVALGCFIIALIALSQLSCTQVDVPIGSFKMYTTINIQNDWCKMPNGDRVNGTTTYSPRIPSVSAICISKKSDDVERTIKHELNHALDNAIGVDRR